MRLIDADALLEKANTYRCDFGFVDDPDVDVFDAVKVEHIKNAPTVDAEPVRHGKWTEKMYGCLLYSECSFCNGKVAFHVDFKYCPQCGAKMDRGDTNSNVD